MSWSLLWIGLGGALGAVSRVALSTIVQRRLGAGLPGGTLVVNLLGCLLLGLAAGWMGPRFKAQPELRLALTAGFLGAFTTYSTFAYETVELWRNGWMMRAAGYVLISLIAGFAGLLLGERLSGA